MTTRKPIRGAAPAALLAFSLSAAAFSGCSIQAGGELGQDQQILATCPADTKPAEDLHTDITATGNGSEIAARNLAAIESIVRRAVICQGHLRVTAFGGTSGNSTKLYEGDIALTGATDIARLRRVPEAVEAVMSEITDAYNAALAQPAPGDGSDIIGQYRLAKEYLAQLGDGYTLELVILTDGFQNTKGVKLSSKTALSAKKRDQIVKGLKLPDLSGASVTVAGIGRVEGDQPSSQVVEGLVSFYDKVCERTGASKCLSVTDYTTGK